MSRYYVEGTDSEGFKFTVTDEEGAVIYYEDELDAVTTAGIYEMSDGDGTIKYSVQVRE